MQDYNVLIFSALDVCVAMASLYLILKGAWGFANASFFKNYKETLKICGLVIVGFLIFLNPHRFSVFNGKTDLNDYEVQVVGRYLNISIRKPKEIKIITDKGVESEFEPKLVVRVRCSPFDSYIECLNKFISKETEVL